MITKPLHYLTILAALSGVLVVLIPGDPKNALILGLSTSRLAMLAGFIGLAGLFWIAAVWLKTHPDRRERLDGRVNELLQSASYQSLISAGASFLILLALLHLAEWLGTTDAFQKGILLRLLPISLFAGGVGGLAFGLTVLRKQRTRWVMVILLTILCTAGSRVLQDVLLATIERPYVRDVGLQQISQLAAALAAFVLLARLSGRVRRVWLTWGWVTALMLALYLIQWSTYPQKYWPSLRNLALAGPLIVFGGTLLVLSAFDLWDWLGKAARGRMLRSFQIGAILALLLLIAPFLQATFLHSRVLNYSADFVDQAEYLQVARTASLQNFQTTGDHNRMPLYPFFLALFYRPRMSDAAFFELGKSVNVWLSLALLGLLFAFVRNYFSLLKTAMFTALAAFSLYIFKAPYIQSESVYYFLALVGFILMVRLLIWPELRLAISAGVVLGLAHLTKASILPGLLLFTALFLLKTLIVAVRLLGRKSLSWQKWRSVADRLGILAMTLICFLAVIFPYIRAMKASFGQYFYNVNTTFYIWYDSNAEAIAAEAKYHFAQAWPSQFAPDELPGPAKYFREHSPAQILERIRFGLQAQAGNLLEQFSVTNYQLSYLAILVFVFLADLRRSLRLAGEYRYAVVYSVLYFVGYLAAFVWYSPISPERRFTYGLYLPFLFSAFITLRELAKPEPAGQPPAGILDVARFTDAAQFIIFLTLTNNIYFVLVERMFFDRYGS